MSGASFLGQQFYNAELLLLILLRTHLSPYFRGQQILKRSPRGKPTVVCINTPAQESLHEIKATKMPLSSSDSDSASSFADKSPPSPDAPPPSKEEESPPSPHSDAPETSPPAPPAESGSSLPPPPPDNSNSSPPKSPPLSPQPPISGSSGSNNSSSPASGNVSLSPPWHRAPPSDALSSPPPARSFSVLTEGMLPQISGNSGLLSKNNLKLVIGVSVVAGALVVFMILFCVLCKKKKRRHSNMQYHRDHEGASGYYNNRQNTNWGEDNKEKLNGITSGLGWHAVPPPMSSDTSTNYGPALPPPSPSMALGFYKSTFTYDELSLATSAFAQENLLGQGGFGYVHKGKLPSGKLIAVKSLKSGSGQGEREFQAEVDIISRVHHRHLVSLVGYCIAGGQRMLVYEFVPNKTLEYHLHTKGLPVMDWPTRLRIAIGSARGLAYLHEDCHPKIIHRDIKSANILLDYNFEAMVADFGLAKLSTDNHTHVSTRVMGTFGYLAPEYASSGKLTEKSDVFSFGVMLLEIITGKRPVDRTNPMEDGLVDWAGPLLTRALEEGNYDELVDFRLEKNYIPQEMQRLVACADASIRHSAKKRPRMSQIVRALEGDVSLDDLNEGARTGQNSILSGNRSSFDYDTLAYNVDMKRFRQIVL